MMIFVEGAKWRVSQRKFVIMKVLKTMTTQLIVMDEASNEGDGSSEGSCCEKRESSCSESA